jgi:arabinofuranan 3-O-arabinosyltransferase
MNLLIAAGAAAATVAAGYDLWLWAANYVGDNFHNDFTFYYAAARLGLAHGWSGLYNLDLQQRELDAIGSRIRIAQLARYVSPPPLAWLVVPLTSLPYRVAYWAWSATLVAALAVAWHLSAPGRGRVRLLLLLAAVGWLPIVYGLQLGQPALLVAAAVAGCAALLRKDRQVAAGALLGIMLFKPQLGILVPAALLVSGRWRAFAGSAVVLAVLAAASAIALGPDGISTYQARLAFATTVPENQSQTLAAWIHNLLVTRAAQAMIAAWTLALVYRFRSRGPDLVIAIALVGGLAASPYAHYDDLTMLGLAALLFLRTSTTRWTVVYAIALVILGEGFPIWGAGPVLAGELIALAAWSVAGLREGGPEAEAILGRSELPVPAAPLREPLSPRL